LYGNNNTAAGMLCTSCNQFSLSDGSNCVWCSNNTCISDKYVSQCTSAPGAVWYDNSREACPDPCAPVPAVVGQCKFDPLQTSIIGGFSAAQCAIVNNNSYVTSSMNTDNCYKLAINNASCLAALQRYDCSSSCQACVPAGVSASVPFVRLPCASVCASIVSACPSSVVQCASARTCAAAGAPCAAAIASARNGDSMLTPVAVRQMRARACDLCAHVLVKCALVDDHAAANDDDDDDHDDSHATTCAHDACADHGGADHVDARTHHVVIECVEQHDAADCVRRCRQRPHQRLHGEHVRTERSHDVGRREARAVQRRRHGSRRAERQDGLDRR
jgi:hypothetical protein